MRSSVAACSVSASGVTCQLTPSQVTVPANGSSTAALEITVNAKPAVVPFDIGGGIKRLRVPVFFGMILLGMLIGYTIWVPKEYPGNLRPAWRSAILLSGLATVILGVASCAGGGSVGGGGSGGSGNGGGGGGGATITTVTVQGSAGGTVVSLGSVSVTTP